MGSTTSIAELDCRLLALPTEIHLQIGSYLMWPEDTRVYIDHAYAVPQHLRYYALGAINLAFHGRYMSYLLIHPRLTSVYATLFWEAKHFSLRWGRSASVLAARIGPSNAALLRSMEIWTPPRGDLIMTIGLTLTEFPNLRQLMLYDVEPGARKSTLLADGSYAWLPDNRLWSAVNLRRLASIVNQPGSSLCGGKVIANISRPFTRIYQRGYRHKTYEEDYEVDVNEELKQQRYRHNSLIRERYHVRYPDAKRRQTAYDP